MSFTFRPILAAAAIALAMPAFAQTTTPTAPTAPSMTAPSTMSAPKTGTTPKQTETKAVSTDAKSSSVGTKDKVAANTKTEAKHHHKSTGTKVAKNETKTTTPSKTDSTVTK